MLQQVHIKKHKMRSPNTSAGSISAELRLLLAELRSLEDARHRKFTGGMQEEGEAVVGGDRR